MEDILHQTVSISLAIDVGVKGKEGMLSLSVMHKCSGALHSKSFNNSLLLYLSSTSRQIKV